MTRLIGLGTLLALGLLTVVPAIAVFPHASAKSPVGNPTSAPFNGDGRLVPDPTTKGHITERMLHTLNEAEAAFNGWPWGASCWDRHAWNPTSDHPQGRACDFTVGRIGRLPGPTDRDQGWKVAEWARSNADRLGISYVIWDGHIWSAARSTQGWRAYAGGGVYDPSSITGGHRDHVHVSVVSG